VVMVEAMTLRRTANALAAYCFVPRAPMAKGGRLR